METPVDPAPAKTPVGGAVRDAGKEKAMVTFRRKAAERNPASTAALRRIAISLNQRRALRHPACATSCAAAGSKKLREEIMEGTFAHKASLAWVPTHAEIITHR